MADFATVADVEALWRPLTPEETTQATGLLGYASRIIRAQVPSVDQRILDGEMDPDLARDVAAAMVRRSMMNPAGVRQEAAGQMSVTYDTAVSSGVLYLTPGEVALLNGVPWTGGFGTINVSSAFTSFLGTSASSV